MRKPSFTVGIEEEYMLVDPQSYDLVTTAPAEFLPACKKKLGDQVSPEFLQCQVEVGTRVCTDINEAREQLAFLRHTVGAVAREYDMLMVAVSTHPFSTYQLAQTRKKRYQTLATDMQAVIRRLVISGMHVHVGIEDDDLRIDLMNQVSYILPHLLALSTSSPFWRGEETGLRSYRIAVWDEVPRTGIPEYFESYNEYIRTVEVLVNNSIIEDSSKVWWDVRPSAHYPTLEMRVLDASARIDDAICLAAIYRCWLHMLYRLRCNNLRWRSYSKFLLEENRWRAQRYGCSAGLLDFGRGEIIPCSELIDEILSIISDDAEELQCVPEVQHARKILSDGTSADRQLTIYHQQLAMDSTQNEAMRKVMKNLVIETQEGF